MENLKLKLYDAKHVALPHKTKPFWEKTTPRWIDKFVDTIGIENGIYQINKVSDDSNQVKFDISEYGQIPESNVSFDPKPERIELVSIETLIKVPAKINDIYNIPHNQTDIQVSLTLEKIFEKKEQLLFYFGMTEDIYDEGQTKYGLYNYCKTKNKCMTYKGSSFNLNILDEMLSNVWIKPTMFILHPELLKLVLSACTTAGIYPGYVEMFGATFSTWRGIPLVPCDKLFRKNTYDIFLIRTGERDNGVVQLYNNNISANGVPSLVVKENSTDDYGLISYRVSYYFNIAVLSKDSVFLCEFTPIV